jgi:hypothetical protein
MPYTLRKTFIVLDGRLCLKISWMINSPSFVKLTIDDVESQTFWPAGMEMIYNVTMSRGQHDIGFILSNSFGIERIKECSLRGRLIIDPVFTFVGITGI